MYEQIVLEMTALPTLPQPLTHNVNELLCKFSKLKEQSKYYINYSS